MCRKMVKTTTNAISTHTNKNSTYSCPNHLATQSQRPGLMPARLLSQCLNLLYTPNMRFLFVLISVSIAIQPAVTESKLTIHQTFPRPWKCLINNQFAFHNNRLHYNKYGNQNEQESHIRNIQQIKTLKQKPHKH